MGFSAHTGKNCTMDDPEEIQAQICLLEKEMNKTRQQLHVDHSTIRVAHSTPKNPLTIESDSGIITAPQSTFPSTQYMDRHADDFSSREPPVLSGPYDPDKRDEFKGTGARPKEFLDRGSFGKGTSETPKLSPIPEPQVRFNHRIRQDSPKSKTGKNPRRDIKIATYDGSGEWKDYKSHFTACAVINSWDYEDKGLYLAAALRGQAQGVLGDLPEKSKSDFDSLVKALEERFAPPNQNELYRVQLKERKQRASDITRIRSSNSTAD